jgi:nicotinamidase/pyrazinamidase
MKILLVVDLQNDFCPGGGLGVNDGDTIVPIVNQLIAEGQYDVIVASQDWHPANHCSFDEWPVHCVQGTLGAELRSDLLTAEIDKIILKGTNPNIDSYSAFFDNAKLESTGLSQYLEEVAARQGKTLHDCEIDIVGLAFDYCVKFSALDAQKLGLNTAVIFDATKSVNLNQGDANLGILSDEEKTIQELTQAGVNLKTSREIFCIAERGRSIAPLERCLGGKNEREIPRGISI